MRILGSIALVLASVACGGDDPSTRTFGDAVDDFVQTGCIDAAACFSHDPQRCENDVRTDLADAEAMLDELGQAQCVACLDAKTAQIRAVIEAGCDTAVADQRAVLAACDLDPTIDYDNDGTPDNDADEACAGFP